MTAAEQDSRRSVWRALPDAVRRIVKPVARAFGRIANLGTEGYPPDTQRRLKIVNMISALIAISTAIYAVQQSLTDYSMMKPVIFLNLALAAMAAMVPLAHRINDLAGSLLLIAAEFVALMGFTAYFGHLGGAQIHYIIAAAAPFVIFERRRFWLAILIVLAALVLHLVAWFHFPQNAALLPVNDKMLTSLYTQAAVTTFGLIAASVYYAFSLVERAKAETETVLRNVLPDSVVERLKSDPDDGIADGFAEASVLFADITGFVALARRLGPEHTVALLNRLVSAFDALAQRHGVEKIKTIGDAYMVASGVPVPRADHIQALARMALDMLVTVKAISEQENVSLNLRIGMAAGPMMAGVIGKKKFSYDVWGDPVNLASRLEGLSTPGRILICPICRSALDADFVLEARGTIEVKGVGGQEAWFLVGRR